MNTFTIKLISYYSTWVVNPSTVPRGLNLLNVAFDNIDEFKKRYSIFQDKQIESPEDMAPFVNLRWDDSEISKLKQPNVEYSLSEIEENNLKWVFQNADNRIFVCDPIYAEVQDIAIVSFHLSLGMSHLYPVILFDLKRVAEIINDNPDLLLPNFIDEPLPF